ncbi:MAG: sugar phosphate isomerase/epimerase [Bacteroidales bacterium]|nr:sugar phosphate isomerase/epimerase [Bacteroidales bacterium]
MKITRKEFLNVAAGAAAMTVIPASGALATACSQPSSSGKPKRGVSVYSYSGEMFVTMTLEDCMKDMYDMGAEGLEILANGHIENYPNPTDEWCENFFAMCDKYNIKPVEYGHWVDSRLYDGRELDAKESYNMLVRDIKLANKLGFTVMRTKLGVINGLLEPVTNWREFIEMALPEAEEYNVRMCPEIHKPTLLKSQMVDDYVEFIERTGTKNFGINIDFGVFQNRPTPTAQASGGMGEQQEMSFSLPEDMIPLLPYTYACHAKFTDMSEDLVETTIPYDEILKILIQNKWDGYLLSEYEGPNREEPGYSSDQLRRQHIMMKRLLGEV